MNGNAAPKWGFFRKGRRIPSPAPESDLCPGSEDACAQSVGPRGKSWLPTYESQRFQVDRGRATVRVRAIRPWFWTLVFSLKNISGTIHIFLCLDFSNASGRELLYLSLPHNLVNRDEKQRTTLKCILYIIYISFFKSDITSEAFLFP